MPDPRPCRPRAEQEQDRHSDRHPGYAERDDHPDQQADGRDDESRYQNDQSKHGPAPVR